MSDEKNKSSFERKGIISSSNLEEFHLIVPKTVAADFRRIAKKTRISTSALFEEMVAAYLHGID